MTSGVETPNISSYKLNVTLHEDHLKQTAENGETTIWRKEKELGKGDFGSVRLEKAVIAGKESRRAVKAVSRDFYINHKLDFQRELQELILVQDHPDLFLEFSGWYEDDSQFFMAMEYAPLGDLGSYIKEFKEDARSNATSITQQLLEALVVLHGKKIHHRNLKPSNVFIVSVSPLRVKLVGFEASQAAINSRLKTSHGLISYSAPEMRGFLDSVHQSEREYPSAVDIWALGCLVHEILTGETPFLDHDFVGTAEELNLLANDMPHLRILISFCLGEIPLPTEKLKSSKADTEAIDFIKQLLVAQPDSRPSAMEALDHVWLLGCKSYDKFKLETTISEGGVVHTALGTTNEAITTEWADVRVIGRGGFGTVSLQKGVVRGLECGFRAVKRVHKDFHKLGLSREVSAMIAVKDRPEMFVQLFGWFEAYDSFCIAMEYLEYGDLDEYLLAHGREMRPQIGDITRQILKGLVVLHRRNICHRDLKPQNVLIESLSPVRVKLADFGISKTTVGTLLRTRVGSSGYLAPELQGLGPRTRHDSDAYTNAVDMWSMGCMVYKMFTVSKLPFMLEEDSYSASMSSFIPESGTNVQPSVNITLLHDFCRGATDLPLGPLREADVSEKGIDFIKRLLAPDPRSRIQATAALGHKWFTEQEPKSLDELERVKAEIISLEKDPLKTESFVLAYREGGNSDTIHNILIAMGESPESLAHKASDKGYTLLLDMLLKVFMKSNDMLISTFKGCTFLQTAAKRGHLPVVELLLTYGADLNTGPGDLYQGRTALQYAAEHGHLHLVTFLIQKGADIHSKPAQTGGLTALQAAASRGHLEILRSLIIEYKADVNEEPCKASGRTALQAAAENGHTAAVDFLLHNGAKVNAVPCDQKGRTALQAAAGNGHFTIVKMLLENSAEVNASPCSSFGRTALQAAAERGHSKVVRLLLESMADINAEPCRKKGKTALWAAAEGGHFDVVRLLLENGADINCDRCGQTASEIAEENGHFDIAEFISEF